MPIVNEVRRKVFETDSNGNIIYREGIDKEGNKKMYPVQKKDETGKNIFKVEQGKFLNCDQFWKHWVVKYLMQKYKMITINISLKKDTSYSEAILEIINII